MANSDSDDILSGDFLEPGELLDSDEEFPENNNTSARTSQSILLNRPKLNRNTFQTASASTRDEQPTHYSPDITDKQIQYILNSLGMNKNNKDIQLNALHLHGVMGMTSKDIIDYFDKYEPKFLEWVSNSECNVVWLDDRMPTKALLDLTRPIRELKHIISAVEELNDGNGILNENSNDDYMDQDDVLVSEDYVSCVGTELPPGMWRKAIKPHAKNKCILMRYSTVHDKKDVNNKNTDAEDGEYALFSQESRKRRFVPISINHPDIGDEVLKDDVRWKLAKNPGIKTWTAVAKTWSQYDNAMDAKYKSKVRTPSPPPPTSSSGAASEDDDDYNEARYRERKIPRMRMYADDETQISTRKRLNSSSNSRHQVNIANDLRERLNGRLVSAKVAKAIRAAKANQHLSDESFEVDVEDVKDEEYTEIPFSRATRRDIPRRQYLHEDDGDYTSDEDAYEKRHIKSRLGPHRKHSYRYKARSVSPLQIQINNDKYKRTNRR